MLKDNKTFSSFSVNDLQAAKTFYSQTLGLDVAEDAMGLTLKTAGGNNVFVYAKADHAAASFTVLNFMVDNIDQTVSDLTAAGIKLERYAEMPQDEAGILRGRAAGQGPDIAWFKDPAGNILSILQGD